MSNSIAVIGMALATTGVIISSVNTQSIANLQQNVDNLTTELQPNLPVKTNNVRNLISEKINLDDISFVPILNPVTENVNINNHELMNIQTLQIKNDSSSILPHDDNLTLYANGNDFLYKTPNGTEYKLSTSDVLTNYLPLSGGTMLGDIDMNFNNLLNISELNSNPITEFVRNETSTNIINHIVLFDGSNNCVHDSGHILDEYLEKTGGILTGNLVLPNGLVSAPSLQIGSSTVGLSALSGALQLSTLFGLGLSIASATGIITIPSLNANGIVHNSSGGVLSTSLIVNADITNATIANSKLATIASINTSGAIVVRDGSGNFSAGTITASLTGHASLDLALTGGTMSGTLAMGSQNITGTGSISAGSLSASNTTVSSSISTGAIVSAGGLGVAGAINAGGIIKTTNTTESFSTTTGSILTAGGIGVGHNIFVGVDCDVSGRGLFGPTQPLFLNGMGRLTIRGGNGQFAGGPHVNVFVDSDIYPLTQAFNHSHNNIAWCFDSYFGGSSYKSSSLVCNMSIYKNLDGLNFQYASGIEPGSDISFTTAGYIEGTTGLLHWVKPIKTFDTTESSSPITGALISAGGLGIAKKAFIGTNAIIGSLDIGITFEQTLTLRGQADNITGPNIIAYTTESLYPCMHITNKSHNNVAINFDSYFNDAWRSSNVNSNYQIHKNSNLLQFNYATGSSAGSAISWTTAGFINTSGALQWNQNLSVGGASTFGSGTGCIGIANATIVPSTDPSGGGVLYVENGILKYRGSAGTITPIALA